MILRTIINIKEKIFIILLNEVKMQLMVFLELAKEGEHPRAYEVAWNGIKQVAEVTEKLR